MFDGGHVDGPEGSAGGVPRHHDVATQSAGEASQSRRTQVEGGAGLHDRPRTAGPDGQPVSCSVMPRQVSLQLELLRNKNNYSKFVVKLHTRRTLNSNIKFSTKLNLIQ